MELIFATHNKHKLSELQQILQNQFHLVSLDDLNHYDEIEETGLTLIDNAILKARFIHNQYNLDTFADDTGLEIEALNGAPGVLSARFAGAEKSAINNMKKVLELMTGVTNRKAQFKTVIALIINNREFLFEGIVTGEILKSAIGDKGFGYDPIFQPQGYSVSFAQMDAQTKNKISHRGKAVLQLVDFLKKLPI